VIPPKTSLVHVVLIIQPLLEMSPRDCSKGECVGKKHEYVAPCGKIKMGAITTGDVEKMSPPM